MSDAPELNVWREAYAARRDTLEPTTSQQAAAVIRSYGDQRDAEAYQRGKIEGARLAIAAVCMYPNTSLREPVRAYHNAVAEVVKNTFTK